MALFISAILMVVALYLVIQFYQALLETDEEQSRQREMLDFQVSGMRLGRLLEKLHINRWRMIYGLPAKQVAVNIKRCQSCKAHRQCDQVLRSASDDISIQFCPNENSLKKLK